ncbi:MAG TPA: polysaccharide deacetylase family protein [Verrucomicrobiae bacterium]|nr:polysaccharide deacetylase family protein [Verrucomicrobiae bacterium]
MSRFHTTLIVAAILGGAALAAHQFVLCSAVILALFVAIGFGVAIPQMRFFGPFICRGSNSKKQIALTFDDGPDTNSTPQLLELLREEKIEAAFFCVGKKIEVNPELARQILRDSHLLENHSYAHSNFTNFFSATKLQNELACAQNTIQVATNTTSKFFRPPIGLSNPTTFRVAKKMNLQIIGWSVRSLDTVIASPQKIVARVARKLHPGAIILLHDGNIPAEKLVVTVKLLLATLRELGYEVARLDKILK